MGGQHERVGLAFNSSQIAAEDRRIWQNKDCRRCQQWCRYDHFGSGKLSHR